MNKRKIILLATALCLVAILAMGGTLAYFMDTDTQTNVFVIGNVAIDLFEDFNSEKLNLTPGVGEKKGEDGNYVTEITNTIEKEVYIENTGSEEAYVRVHIAIPALTRDGQNINVLELLCNDQSTVNGQWNWGTTADANFPPRDGGTYNMYRNITINGVPYKVFVLTYETMLKPGDVTTDAISKVYMDSLVTNQEVAAWNATYGEEWKKIYVLAEAVQADGFTDTNAPDNFGEAAFTAFETAYGANVARDAADFTATFEGKDFAERESLEGK